MEAWLELARAYISAGALDCAAECHKEGTQLTPEGRAVMIMQAGLLQARPHPCPHSSPPPLPQ